MRGKCLLALLFSLVWSARAIKDHERLDLSQISPRKQRACSVYVWDAPSALLRTWSDHLLRNCIIEGKGGKKFMRVPSGSLAALLYPARNLSKSRCILCGGRFESHLRLWWHKYLYIPWDRLTDSMREEASAKGGYYHAYVLDLDAVYRGCKTQRQRRKALKRALSEHPAQAQKYQVIKEGELRYIVPNLPPSNNPVLDFARELLLQGALSNLIELDRLHTSTLISR